MVAPVAFSGSSLLPGCQGLLPGVDRQVMQTVTLMAHKCVAQCPLGIAAIDFFFKANVNLIVDLLGNKYLFIPCT